MHNVRLKRPYSYSERRIRDHLNDTVFDAVLCWTFTCYNVLLVAYIKSGGPSIAVGVIYEHVQ